MRIKVVGFTLSALLSALCFFGAMLLALSVPVQAQQAGKVYRIGYLAPNSASPPYPRVKAFREGLRELGYVEGQNLVIVERSAEGKRDRLPALAAELVGLNLDVIFAFGTSTVRALKKATKTIPIVSTSSDPVRNGLVASLARPGGNITGLANLTPELAGKRLELLREVVPRISRVAVIWDPARAARRIMRETEAAANSLDIKLQPIAVRVRNDIEPAFSAMKKERADALVPLRSVLVMKHYRRIVQLAAKNRLPAMYDGRLFAEAGGLMSYGTLIADLDRRAATYVDKILKGANPADLPIEQPTTYELVVNLKTA
ncbi:MAG: ABC transporter substrate-binding protein, partial [Candidatus Binatia bacterium]